MKDKNENIIGSETAANIIAFLGVICTIASLLLGSCQIKETIKHESGLTQKATMLEQTKELPMKMQEFLKEASLALKHYVFYNNEGKEEDLEQFEEHNKRQKELLEELTIEIIAYGSDEVISIFSEFYQPLSNNISEMANGGTVDFNEWVKMYYSLPLLMSLVKYDTTGELVNPSVMLDYLMPEFKKFQPSIMDALVEKNDELVTTYELDESFKWKS